MCFSGLQEISYRDGQSKRDDEINGCQPSNWRAAVDESNRKTANSEITCKMSFLDMILARLLCAFLLLAFVFVLFYHEQCDGLLEQTLIKIGWIEENRVVSVTPHNFEAHIFSSI